jgi:hypothetical protein
MKIVINTCYGGFDLSETAKQRYIDLSGETPKSWDDLDRTDEYLIQVVEELGEAANTFISDLKVEELTECCLYRITEYDGKETLQRKYLDDGWKVVKEN